MVLNLNEYITLVDGFEHISYINFYLPYLSIALPEYQKEL